MDEQSILEVSAKLEELGIDDETINMIKFSLESYLTKVKYKSLLKRFTLLEQKFDEEQPLKEKVKFFIRDILDKNEHLSQDYKKDILEYSIDKVLEDEDLKKSIDENIKITCQKYINNYYMDLIKISKENKLPIEDIETKEYKI